MKFKLFKSSACNYCKHCIGWLAGKHGECLKNCCQYDNLQNKIEWVKHKCPNYRRRKT